jgi:hypothetical protein
MKNWLKIKSPYDSMNDFLHKVVFNLIFNQFFLKRVNKRL